MKLKPNFLIGLLFITTSHAANQIGVDSRYRTVRLLKPATLRAEFFILYSNTPLHKLLETIRQQSGNKTPKTIFIKNGGEIVPKPDIFTDRFFEQYFPDGQTVTVEVIEYEPTPRKQSILGFNT